MSERQKDCVVTKVGSPFWHVMGRMGGFNTVFVASRPQASAKRESPLFEQGHNLPETPSTFPLIIGFAEFCPRLLGL